MSRVQIKGAAVFLTGASSGIGRALAGMLVGEGARVAGVARSADRLQSLAETLKSEPGEFCPLTADISDPRQSDGAVDETVRRFGGIDVMICNAGEYVRAPVRSATVADFEHAMAVNFYGSIRPILRVLPRMLEKGRGSIAAVTSMDGRKGLPQDVPYVASKFALTGFMDVLRQELHGTGVSATTILPGRVDTPMIRRLSVPWVSAKISSERTARAVLRGVRRRSAEVLVPYAGLKMLAAASTVHAPLADWLVRILRLEGEEEKPT